MKRNKTQKGITLVALIITIIVLLILAVVAIRAVQGDGIIGHAKNAREQYEQKAAEENALISELSGYITGQISNKENCLHENTEVRNIMYYDVGFDADLGLCKAYTGDTYCKECNQLIQKGASVTYVFYGVAEILFDQGMTWGEWIDSPYNTLGWYIQDDEICSPKTYKEPPMDVLVHENDKIIGVPGVMYEGKSYTYYMCRNKLYVVKSSESDNEEGITTFNYSCILNYEIKDNNENIISVRPIVNTATTFKKDDNTIAINAVTDENGLVKYSGVTEGNYTLSCTYQDIDYKFNVVISLSGCSIEEIDN